MDPIFLYDGQCSFCRFWLARWQRHTAGRVEYVPYQDAGARFPQISTAEFARAAKLRDADGRIYSGAAAVFRLWTYRSGLGRLWWWCYRNGPLFAPTSEAVYRFVARHRAGLWKVTKIVMRAE